MAIVPVLRQTNAALIGQQTWFELAVTNTGGSAVNILAVDPVVTSASGAPGMPFNLGGPYPSPGQNTPSTTNPFNVQITAGATAYFTFSIAMFGSQVLGGPAVGLSQFQVSASVLDSAGTVSVSPAVNVAPAPPRFGLSPGSPPNPEALVGSLKFYAASQSALTSHGI